LLVLEYGGNEDQAIAAILHDSVEDGGGPVMLQQVTDQFGQLIAGYVEALSDSFAEDPTKKAPWRQRKTEYIKGLIEKSTEIALISAADKLYNLRSVRVDHHRIGRVVWGRFNPVSGRAGQLWYYSQLTEILGVLLAKSDTTGQDLAAALDRELLELLEQIAADPVENTTVTELYAEITAFGSKK